MVAGDLCAGRRLPPVGPFARFRHHGRESTVVHAVLADERAGGKRAHVQFVKPRLHRRDVDLVGIRQMPRRGRQTSGHGGDRHRAHVPLRIDDVGADEELVRLAVDQPVGGGAAHGLGADDLPQIGLDFVELVGRTRRAMRSVGNHPERTGPRDHRPRTAFALVVVTGQMRVDSVYFNRICTNRRGHQCRP